MPKIVNHAGHVQVAIGLVLQLVLLSTGGELVHFLYLSLVKKPHGAVIFGALMGGFHGHISMQLDFRLALSTPCRS